MIYPSGKYPVFGGNGIRGFSSTFNHDGDFALIGRQGALCGNISWSSGKAFFTEHAVAVQADEEQADTRFMYYQLGIMNLGQYSGQSAQPGLAVNKIIKLESSFPSKEEQHKIGSFFTQLDHTITLQQRKLNSLQKLKKGLLQKMFPKKGENIPEIRFPKFSDAWKQRKLCEFVNFYSGLTYKPEDVNQIGTFVLRSSNVKNGEILDADNVYVNEDIAKSEKVQLGDIIVVVRNGSRDLIGKHATVKRSMPNTVIGAFMTGIRAKEYSFVNALLDTNQFEKEINKNLGATINQITGYMFSNMSFTIPSEEEQHKIGSFFTQLDNTITLQQRWLFYTHKQS